MPSWSPLPWPLTTTSVAYADGGATMAGTGTNATTTIIIVAAQTGSARRPSWPLPAWRSAAPPTAMPTQHQPPSIRARVYAPPAAVHSAPPARSGGFWYFCGSSGQYYPYTNACRKVGRRYRPAKYKRALTARCAQRPVSAAYLNGCCLRMVSSRSGPVDTMAIGTSHNSSRRFR